MVVCEADFELGSGNDSFGFWFKFSDSIVGESRGSIRRGELLNNARSGEFLAVD